MAMLFVNPAMQPGHRLERRGWRSGIYLIGEALVGCAIHEKAPAAVIFSDRVDRGRRQGEHLQNRQVRRLPERCPFRYSRPIELERHFPVFIDCRALAGAKHTADLAR